MKLKLIYTTFTLIFVSLSFYNCSSVTQSQRYGRKPQKESEPAKTVRFTSEDSNKNETSTSYNDPVKTINEFDEAPVEEYTVDKKAFVKKYKNLKELNLPLTKREKILFEIVNYLDSPYLYGGNTKSGIDCSAFTSNVFKKAIDLQLPRVASQQFIDGQEVPSFNQLTFGDLVFFNTSKSSFPGHVGIYLGNDLFAHASVSHGVTISNIKDKYYKEKYVGARRIEKFK